MAKNDDKMPDTVFLGPSKHRAQFKYMVFLVVKSDADGVPLVLRMVKEEEEVNIAPGTEFMLGYVPIHMTQPEKTKAAMLARTDIDKQHFDCECGHCSSDHVLDLASLKQCCKKCSCNFLH